MSDSTKIPFVTNKSIATTVGESDSVSLPYRNDKCYYLTSAVINIGGAPMLGFEGVAITQQWLAGELWLLKGGMRIKLDWGFVGYDANTQRSVIGFHGRIGYDRDDKLFYTVKNYGTGTLVYSVSYSVDCSDNPLNESFDINRLHDDVSFLQQFRRVTTQNGAGGGALVNLVSCANNQIGVLHEALVTGSASAGATLIVQKLDEDATACALVTAIAAGVSRTATLPTTGSAPNNSQGQIVGLGMKLAPSQSISFASSAAIQTETLTVALLVETNTPEPLTWATTGSGGTPALAANTISSAASLVAVVRPRLVCA